MPVSSVCNSDLVARGQEIGILVALGHGARSEADGSAEMMAVATGRQITHDLAVLQDGLGVIEQGLWIQELELQQPAVEACLPLL